MRRREDEFYVGWLPTQPTGVARRVRFAVLSLAILAPALLALLLLAPKRLPESRFEFGVVREFAGVLLERPVPLLWVPTAQRSELFLLVARGKFGADSQVAGWDGRGVRVRGTLIERDRRRMIEVVAIVPDVVPTTAGGADTAPPVTRLGRVVVAGEIVDSKCYLGVMAPGEGKVHKDCAIRCLSGGVPPALAIRAADGSPTVLALLTDQDGRPVGRRLLDRVAEPVELEGEASRIGGQIFLAVDPRAVRRLGGRSRAATLP